MFLGSVAGGIMMGLCGALMTWIGGHPVMAVLLSYAVIGSLGTLMMAALTTHDEAGAGSLPR